MSDFREGSRVTAYAIDLDSVVKVYGSGRAAVRALSEVTLALPRGSFTAHGSFRLRQEHLPPLCRWARPADLGALDTRTGRQTLELLRQVVSGTGQTVLMVTHDPVAASGADSVVFLADGKLAGTLSGPTPEKVADRMTRLGEG
jgi:hypothetical protein